MMSGGMDFLGCSTLRKGRLGRRNTNNNFNQNNSVITMYAVNSRTIEILQSEV